MNSLCFRPSVVCVASLLFLLLPAAAQHGNDAAKRTPAQPFATLRTGHVKISPNTAGVEKAPPISSDELDDEEQAPDIPVGPDRPSKPVPAETPVEPAPDPGVDPDGFEILRSCVVGNASGPIHGSKTNEPSGAVSDSGETGAPNCKDKKGTRTVFVTANKYAAFSADNGATFTQIDLSKIPNFHGSLCCDQVAAFIPKINRVVWVMLVRLTPKPGAVQIMAASPEKIVSSHGEDWSAWSIHPAQLGLPASSHFDFPGIAVGDNSLYVNFDSVGGEDGMIVSRIPLDEIKAGGALDVDFTHSTDSPRAVLGHITEDPGDEVFWAQHNDNSHMRVFSWRENSDSVEARDIRIDAWPDDRNKMTSLTPDCQDWLAATTPGRIRGAARFKGKGADDIWFAWTASAGEGFGQAHVEWVKFDHRDNFNPSRGAIHDGVIAYGYPALATNSDGDLGLSLEAGGGAVTHDGGKKCEGGKFENYVVGFLHEGKFHRISDSQAGLTRFGDYVTIHRDSQDKSRFDAFGYGMDPAGSGMDPVPTTHYVIFGRPPSTPVCTPCRCLDGFQPPGSLCFGTASCQNACVNHAPDTRCICESGFEGGPESRAGTEACLHICEAHKSKPKPPPPTQ